MKILLPLLLLNLLFSCGKVDNDLFTRIGETRSVEPVRVGAGEIQNLTILCNSIARKSTQGFINQEFIFTHGIKTCVPESDRFLTTTESTTIQQTTDGFKFVKPGGTYFYFSDVETADKGSLSQICQAVKESPSILSSPLASGNEFIYFTTLVSGGDCPPKNNESCILIEKAFSDGLGGAKVHTKEWVRINVDTTNPRVGFFTLKRQITSQGCPEGKELAHTAELK